MWWRRFASLVSVVGAVGCGDPMSPTIPLSFSSVDAGGFHTCGVTLSGDVYCWGRGVKGQLGDGRIESTALPVKANAGAVVFTSVAVGEQHTCALDDAGAAYCWGVNQHGQLGAGSTVGLGLPYPVLTEERFSRLSAGWFHTCGISLGGDAYCWGHNGQGQLGVGSTESWTFPVAIADGRTYQDISAGGYHTCAVTIAGEAYCWGLNFLGQLGNGETMSALTPVQVSGGTTYSAVTAGFTHSCGVSPNGRAECWGSNGKGELGNSGVDAATAPGATIPAQVHWQLDDGLEFVAIDAGLYFTCAIDHRQRAWCWGEGEDGQLGANELGHYPVPRKVFATTDMQFDDISAGAGRHACATTTSLGGFCWGASPDGALGPVTTFSTQPVRIPGTR